MRFSVPFGGYKKSGLRRGGGEVLINTSAYTCVSHNIPGNVSDSSLFLYAMQTGHPLIFERGANEMRTIADDQFQNIRDAVRSLCDDMAKFLAAKASSEAANACQQFHGGFGFASEYDVERKFRETRLYQVAPISTNLILSSFAEHVLGLPRPI